MPFRTITKCRTACASPICTYIRPADTFPVYAALVWGTVLYLFEHEPGSLQGALRTSMEYLYHDSNRWHDLRTWLWHNK